jgi:hypothetical protein
MPARSYPQYVRHSQRYAPVSSQGDKTISLATSPTLMGEGLQSAELDRMTVVLSDRLQEIIARVGVCFMFLWFVNSNR